LQALVPMFARFEKSDLNHQCAHAAFVDGNEKWEAWRKARSVLSSNMRGAG
jgi:hypothetical protein